MGTACDVNPNELIEKAAGELKKLKELQMPEWSNFVKTGVHKERHPESADWWYYRAAAVLRKIYLRSPVGVSKLRKMFGGKKNRGVKPEKFRPAGGKIIRTILQQLEKAGFVKRGDKGVHKGRVITPKGKSFLDTLIKVKNPVPKEKKEKVEVKESPEKTETEEKKNE